MSIFNSSAQTLNAATAVGSQAQNTTTSFEGDTMLLSNRTMGTLQNANITLEAARSMSADELLAVKGIGAVSLTKLQQYFTATPVVNKLAAVIAGIETTVVSPLDIMKVRAHFSTQEVADFLADKATFKSVSAVHHEFLTNDKLDVAFAQAFNTLSGEDLLSKFTGMVVKMMPRFHYLREVMDNHETEKAYFNLAQTIFNGLVEIGTLKYVKVMKSFMVNGRRTYRTELNVVYPTTVERAKREMSSGIHSEPGQVINKRVKPKTGGVSYKYNSTYKAFLKLVASQELYLVEITKEEFYEWGLNEKWFIEGCKQQSRAALREQLDSYYALYLELLGKPLFLSMHGDYRYRNYYDFVNIMLAPHTKHGKYLYKAAKPRVPSAAGHAKYIEFAVTLATGTRHNTADAVAVWADKREELEAILLDSTDKPFGEALYERRLVQAIQDSDNKIPSTFLAAGDNTNGGLQIQAAEFREPVSGKACNIGGLTKPQDSHQRTATAFDVERKWAKDNMNQGILHGGSPSTMQKTLATIDIAMSVVEVETHLIEAYGPTILNLSVFNDTARMMHDNYNPSLKFRTMDGLPAQTIAYIKGLEFDVYGLTLDGKGMYTKRKVSSDMPLKMTNTGEIIYRAESDFVHTKGEKRPATTKMSGAVANVIHSVDGWSMRMILTRVINAGYEGINVHDMYLYQIDAFVDHIMPQYEENLVTIRNEQPLTNALMEMNDNRDCIGRALPLPTLVYGDSTEQMIRDSKCFITA